MVKNSGIGSIITSRPRLLAAVVTFFLCLVCFPSVVSARPDWNPEHCFIFFSDAPSGLSPCIKLGEAQGTSTYTYFLTVWQMNTSFGTKRWEPFKFLTIETWSNGPWTQSQRPGFEMLIVEFAVFYILSLKLIQWVSDQMNRTDGKVVASSNLEGVFSERILCPKCQHDNPLDAFHCQSCGHSLR